MVTGHPLRSPQVSVLVLKLQSLCGALDVQGESTTLSLELGQVLPVQVGNVSVRQYLSNRSLGKTSDL